MGAIQPTSPNGIDQGQQAKGLPFFHKRPRQTSPGPHLFIPSGNADPFCGSKRENASKTYPSRFINLTSSWNCTSRERRATA